MQARNNFGSDVSVNKGFRKLKMFPKDIQLPITPDEPDERDGSIWNIADRRQTKFYARFSDRMKTTDAQRKAQSEDDAKRARVTIASTKTELVVDLEEVWDPNSLPTADQSQGHGLVVFSSLGIDKDAMTVKIHDVKRIEAAIVFDVSGSQEIRLMDVVESQGLGEVGIFHSLGSIGTFF
jgi:hypothetical protein